MSERLQTLYVKARRETAELLGYKLKRLTPAQTTRLDLATALRIGIDEMQGKIVRGETVDVSKMLSASEALAKLLPPAVLAAPLAETARRDPREVLLEELQRMAERGELVDAQQEASEVEHLLERVAELEARIAELEGAGRSPAVSAPAEPALPAGDNVLTLSRAPSPPAAQHAAPAKPFVNGLSDVPRHVRDTRPANEPWRDYVGPDGDISMRPRGGWGFP